MATTQKPTPAKQRAAKKSAPKAAAVKRTPKKAPAKKSTPKAARPAGEKIGFAFPKGNKWWQCRAKHGVDGIWDSPGALLNDCLEYFAWLEKNPFLEDQRVIVKGSLKSYNKTRMRPATIQGLRLHLGIGKTTWHDYRTKKGPDFTTVCEYVEEAIYEQKFAGAASGFLNPVIIARDLGLKDSIAAEVTGAGGGPVQVTYKGVQSDGKRRN